MRTPGLIDSRKGDVTDTFHGASLLPAFSIIFLIPPFSSGTHPCSPRPTENPRARQTRSTGVLEGVYHPGKPGIRGRKYIATERKAYARVSHISRINIPSTPSSSTRTPNRHHIARDPYTQSNLTQPFLHPPSRRMLDNPPNNTPQPPRLPIRHGPRAPRHGVQPAQYARESSLFLAQHGLERRGCEPGYLAGGHFG